MITSMSRGMFILGIFLFTLTSCVSKKKYLSSQSRIDKLRADSLSFSESLATCNASLNQLKSEKGTLEQDLEKLNTNTKMTMAEQARRLNELQAMIQNQKDVMNKLRKSISDALVGFKPDELTVDVKDGNVYVSLQEKLLFKSGSALVDPKGKEALGTVASVLNNNPDISIVIEGHTDTVPIRGKFEDNWALSVARATSIVRILTNDYSVNPDRVIASGRGEFHPVAENTSADGRAKNRRTEIILTPNLEELFKLLNQ